MKIAVIGAGSWGTALAEVLAKQGHDVCIWARDERVVEGINNNHRNPRYLEDVLLSENIKATSSYEACFNQAAAGIIVTPSHLLRKVAGEIQEYISSDFPFLICSKGIEEESGLLPIEVFEAELGNAERLAVLSGPNHAEEVSRSIPSATVIASQNSKSVELFQGLFNSEAFRVYTSADSTGVELCGAFKNIIAIAVGISYGIGYGDNTAALLMTRGMAEMGRLVEASGGDAITCMGLAGAGDLIATCTSQHSRNRRFGESLAQEKTLEDFTSATHMVVEGALACKTIRTLAVEYDLDLPIAQIVYEIIWQQRDPQEAALALATRPPKAEFGEQ